MDFIEQLLERTGKGSATMEVKISGPERNVAEMARMLRFIDYCSGVGHSASFKVFVDGDGAAGISVDGLPDEATELKFEEGDPDDFCLD